MSYLPAGVGDLAAGLANCDQILSVWGSRRVEIVQIADVAVKDGRAAQGDAELRGASLPLMLIISRMLASDQLVSETSNRTRRYPEKAEGRSKGATDGWFVVKMLRC
jgi:hypothetical protein